jgi:hypothetical protein
MTKTNKQHTTMDDLPNVIASLKKIIAKQSTKDEVRELATNVAVYLICLQKDLEHNNII